MKIRNTFFVAFLVVITSFSSCKEEDKQEEEISQISVDLLIERFDKVFYEAHPSDLATLKNTFPFLFSKRIPDSIWVSRMQDTLQKQLLSEVHSKFADFSVHETDLYALNQHLKFYDPLFQVPRVITLTNDVDYRNKVVVTDSIVLIALDNYLGASHEFYRGIPKYKTQNMTEDQIIPDLAKAYAERYIYQSQRKTLLDDMVYFGKRLYFADKMIPFAEDRFKIGYTEEQLEFARLNEEQIWKHLIENEYLYNTDSSLPARFIADAPFTKFYLQLDRESPGRLGRYVGWQIVKAYMKNNDITLMDMLKKDAEEIFERSNYKPPKYE